MGFFVRLGLKKNFIEYTKLINYIPDKITITEFLLIKCFTLVGLKSTEFIFIVLLFYCFYNYIICQLE